MDKKKEKGFLMFFVQQIKDAQSYRPIIEKMIIAEAAKHIKIVSKNGAGEFLENCQEIFVRLEGLKDNKL